MNLTDQTFRILVETIEDYAIFLLDPDGIVQSWNTGARRIKGFEAHEIVGRHFSVFYSPTDRAAHRWQHGLAAARANGHFEDVGWRVRKDGSQFWASVVITALHDEAGGVLGFAKVTRDLTDRAYRAFVEATHAIVWTTDGSGRPNADSPSWRAFTGQTEEEWRGLRGWAPVHPDDQPALRVDWPRAKQHKEPFVAEFRLRRHDGAYVWMACRAIPFLNPDGSVREWFGVTFDISARKTAEQERERALRWWETTLRSIGDGVIATDARGAVTFMNRVAERLTGWTTAEAHGRELAKVFPIFNEDTRAPVESPVEKVLREGTVVGLANHTVLRHRDGTMRAIDDSAAPIRSDGGALDGVVLVFRDATPEKQEANRRAFLAQVSEELMAAADHRAALSRIAGLAVPRLADWCAVDMVEPGTAEIRRLAVAHVDPAKVALAHHFHARYPTDPGADRGVPQVIRTGCAELYRELSHEQLDASAVDDEHRRLLRELDLRSVMIVPLRVAERTFGALTFIYTGQRRYTELDLAFAEDLARRAALLIERRRLEEEAHAASRAKDEFLAMLGHELRNPLAPIRTALQLMGLRGDPATAKERQVIERQVDHLVRLVDDLLDVSRLTRAKIELEQEPIEIGTLIARALEMASPLLEQRQHHVEVQVPREGLVVNADPGRMAQVFSNLLTNAAKFTDPGGHIAVTAARADRGGDREIAVTVADTGVGIAPEFLPSLFEMFAQERRTLERSQGGLGLGLSIVRSLVTMHGGTVSVHSEGRGRGAAFTVRLPAFEGAVASRRAGTAPGEPPARGGRILLVDDNEDAAAMLAELLISAGYDVRVAFDGPSALTIARELSPDLAILDIGLPVMDGYEVAAALRAMSPGSTPRLIALTGYGQEQDQRRATAAGFERYLVKPIGFEALYQTIDELLGS
ncbi:MAG TPA: PAS domain S-box protein [Kofleriaceae bacterium]|nr:PAS domain S-box protein [Kofleriaceae bacterium]